jgi:hypothetical protein
METTQANGHAGPAQPATALPSVEQPYDALDPIRVTVRKLMNQSYADGFRRATQFLSRTVGMLDGESKTKVMATLDLLEEELHKAEEAAK